MIKIKEWLMIWQLNENYVDLILGLDDHFDDKTESLVKEIQNFMGMTSTGIVDPVTWTNLVSPLQRAFSLETFNVKTLDQAMKYFAARHLQFRATELNQKNKGPWIRSYMNGDDGVDCPWCQGSACVILDQVFSSLGIRFDQFYENTLTCEEFRERARKDNLLVTKQELLNKSYVPKGGDMALFLRGPKAEAHHTEVIYRILDSDKGNMLTIGANTNFNGTTHGVGTFLVDRNFMIDKLEVVKMISPEKLKDC